MIEDDNDIIAEITEPANHEIVNYMVCRNKEVMKMWEKTGEDPELDKDEHKAYSISDYQGKGRIKPGDTIQWFDMEIKGTLKDKNKPKYIWESKKYTIKHSVLKDTQDGLIDSKDSSMLIITALSQQDIMESIIETPEGLTLTTIGHITGLSRNTIYRSCKYLEIQKAIMREKDLTYKLLVDDYKPMYRYMVFKCK